MSIDPQVIRSEPHAEIGELLRENVGILLERWSRRAVEEQPNAKRVHHDVLLNHLRDFLMRLGASLAESEDPLTGQHYIPAVIHGEQRWETGWSLTEVVRDYQILRLVILDFLEEALDRPLGYREGLAIGLALDEAITASVVTYVRGRDDYLRQLEEARAEEDRQVRQRLQEQAEALQDADRRKNEFMAMLAHELRNPLAPIRNAVKILELSASPDPQVQWVTEVIDRQVQQMTRLVDDLLDVSRITQGKLKLEKQPVRLAVVVDRAVEMVQSLIAARKHQLTVSLPQEPVSLEADPPRLAQVLANLLMNAAKYTDDGGQIWLTAEAQGDELVITVRDTGMGIPPELLPRVFDPFIQEERSLDRAQGGLGLGLTLVRSLVELHGGRVEASSAGRGQGSQFVLRLPLLKEPAPLESLNGKPPRRERTAARRILVVDDNIDSASSLAAMLRLLGHEVRTAHDGVAALEIAESCSPEVVLLDIGLPRINGLEVARRLRGALHLEDALLVAMTGYGQDSDRRRSQEAGFDAHLVKPIDLDQLQAMLAGRMRSARRAE